MRFPLLTPPQRVKFLLGLIHGQVCRMLWLNLMSLQRLSDVARHMPSAHEKGGESGFFPYSPLCRIIAPLTDTLSEAIHPGVLPCSGRLIKWALTWSLGLTCQGFARQRPLPTIEMFF